MREWRPYLKPKSFSSSADRLACIISGVIGRRRRRRRNRVSPVVARRTVPSSRESRVLAVSRAASSFVRAPRALVAAAPVVSSTVYACV